MKVLFGAIGVLALVIGVVVWQRPDEQPPPVVMKEVVLQYADGSELERVPATGEPKPGLVAAQVLAEVTRAGMWIDDLRKQGATIRTTLDPKAQSSAAKAADTTNTRLPDTLRTSLTAIDPATGAVKAYWPGKREDYARGVLRSPGSAFLPIDLVAALQIGKTLDSTYDGRTPRLIAGQAIRGAWCGQECTLREALAKTTYPVFYDLVVNDIGVQKVKETAHQAGVPRSVEIGGEKVELLTGEGGTPPNGGISLGVDSAKMRPFDLAVVYATFAAGGVHHEPFFIEKITGADGAVLYQTALKPVSAFDLDAGKSKAIADQITGVLQANPVCDGKACQPGVLETPVNNNAYSTAWMAGYTPTLAVSVFVGSDDESKPLRDAAGVSISGTSLPAAIWKTFLTGL